MAKESETAAVLAPPKAHQPPHVRVHDRVTFVNFKEKPQADAAPGPDADADFQDPDIAHEKRTWQPEYPAEVTFVYEGGRVVNLRVDNGERWREEVRGLSGTPATLKDAANHGLKAGQDQRGFDVSKVHWAPVEKDRTGQRMLRPRSWHALGD